MLNWLLSLMVHKKMLNVAEAEHLAKTLITKTHPANFAEAHRIVEQVLKDFKG